LFGSQRYESNHNPLFLIVFMFLTVAVGASDSGELAEARKPTAGDVPEMLDELMGAVRLLSGQVGNLREQLANLTGQFATQQEQIANLAGQFANFTATQREHFENFRRKISRDVWTSHNQSLGLTAVSLALGATIRVEIYPPTREHHNTFGSGSLVSIDDRVYVSTCRHVVTLEFEDRGSGNVTVSNSPRPSPSYSPRPIVSLEGPLCDHLSVDGDVLISRDYDLALIPVTGVGSCLPLQVSGSEPGIGTWLHGISNREQGLVYVYGKVLEKVGSRFESDCQGAHGFSGTGILDPSGNLIALLASTATFRHLSGDGGRIGPGGEVFHELMNSSLEIDWTLARDDCRTAWDRRPMGNDARYDADTATSQDKCFDRLQEAIESGGRTTRMQMEAAMHLIEMVRDPTKRVVLPRFHSDEL
jgi:hypothetical protein